MTNAPDLDGYEYVARMPLRLAPGCYVERFEWPNLERDWRTKWFWQLGMSLIKAKCIPVSFAALTLFRLHPQLFFFRNEPTQMQLQLTIANLEANRSAQQLTLRYMESALGIYHASTREGFRVVEGGSPAIQRTKSQRGRKPTTEEGKKLAKWVSENQQAFAEMKSKYPRPDLDCRLAAIVLGIQEYEKVPRTVRNFLDHHFRSIYRGSNTGKLC